MVGTSSAPGTIPPGFPYSEGVVSFSGLSFDRVVLTTAAPNLGIDNVDATLAPEPASWVMLALGLGVLARFGRRRASVELRSGQK
jgi:hypothetical protein